MKTTKDFTEFGLKDELIQGLDAIGFKQASEVQEQTIPVILEGKDIFALAETGSGKTGSFGIPLIERILRSEEKQTALVLSPTRELAQQTFKFINDLASKLGMNSACFIGGEDMDKQVEEIKKDCTFFVATPGRLCDLLKQGHLDLSNCSAVVFDEADRLFDMGFQKDIEFALSKTQKERQLIMVSATTNMAVLSTAYKFHSHPVEIKLSDGTAVVKNIDHKLAMVDMKEKMPYLINLLRKEEDHYAIIFCNTQFQTHLVAEWLKAMGMKAKPISGRLAQNKRTKLMSEFRKKEVTILVCTDVAARGLDIDDISLVVNYDIPIDASNYVHRIGRTGRAGKSGYAVSLCAFEDCENLDPIYELLGEKIEKVYIDEDEDFATDLCKKPFIDRKTLKVVEKDELPPRSTPEYKKRERKAPGEKEIYKGPRLNKKVFEISSNDEMDAQRQAMEYLRLKDIGLLKQEIKVRGRKKYFFFGPRTNTYSYTIRPIFKRLLTPLLVDMIQKSKLKLYVKVSYKEPVVRINFSGRDEKMLLANNKELLYSFETVAKVFLQSRIEFPNNFRMISRVDGGDKSEKKLLDSAKKARGQVLKSKKKYIFKSLNPAQRRIIHQFFQDDKDLKTTSIGNGRMKKVEISFR